MRRGMQLDGSTVRIRRSFRKIPVGIVTAFFATVLVVGAGVTISSALGQQKGEFTPSDRSANFGFWVALSGRTAVVGNYSHQVGSNPTQGIVYVFTRSKTTGAWSQTAELKASDGGAGDEFGYTVAVSGNTILVGAPGHNNVKGAVYVYTDLNGTWTQTAELTASDGVANDVFGHAVAISGKSAAIAAIGQGNDGAVYVFTKGRTKWVQTGELKASDGKVNDIFGNSVGISGSHVVVGAQQHQVGSNFQQGAAYVFTKTNGTWSQTAELTASGGAANDIFGQSVAISGTSIFVGGPSHQVGSNTHQGAAYVFTDTNGTWSQSAELHSSDGAANDNFGWFVIASGRTAVIGAPGHSAAYVFTQSKTTGKWSQALELRASDGPGGAFGWTEGVSGKTTLVGSPFAPGNGAAYVFSA